MHTCPTNHYTQSAPTQVCDCTHTLSLSLSHTQAARNAVSLTLSSSPWCSASHSLSPSHTHTHAALNTHPSAHTRSPLCSLSAPSRSHLRASTHTRVHTSPQLVASLSQSPRTRSRASPHTPAHTHKLSSWRLSCSPTRSHTRASHTPARLHTPTHSHTHKQPVVGVVSLPKVRP